MKLVKVFKENKQFTLFSILALVVVGVAVFAPQIAPYDPLDAVMLESLQAPSSAHPFGTDKLGRDLLSRVIFGTRTSLIMTLCLHSKVSKEEAWKKGVSMIEKMRLPEAENIMNSYPHQLSGGMRQRVMIAMALACRPKLLIADEPTTALDVTIQAQILRLMNDLKRENGTSILFITHDLGVINQMADYVAVMYCGQVVERVPAKMLFDPKTEFSHPYTEGLLVSIPRLDTPTNQRLEAIPGAVPHPLDLPKGCKFAPRCKYATEKCHEAEPPMTHLTEEHHIRCYYPNKEERKQNVK